VIEIGGRPAGTVRPAVRRRLVSRGGRHGTLTAMLLPITVRDVGTAAIVVGLPTAVLALSASSAGTFMIAGLLVFVGVGLRLEAALRAKALHPEKTAESGN
jgi:hypothetical protein